MSSTIIVVDTNIVAGSPGLRSESWQSLIAQRETWDLRFLIPDVVQMESVNVVKRHWRQQLQKVKELRVGEFGLVGAQASMIEEIDRRISEYERDLAIRFAEIDATVVSLQNVDVLEIARRASDRRAPYVDNRTQQEKSDKGVPSKDGFRDTLIWLIVLDIALNNPACDVWFISQNYRDFGSRRDDNPGVDTDACPYPLHTELSADLEDAGLAERVFYVRTLERLEQHLASQFASVPPEERAGLVDQIDQRSLTAKLEQVIVGSEIAPGDAGLPLASAVTSLAAFEVRSESLSLVDAARRAGGTWTAQFTVTIDAVIDVFDSTGNLTTIRKPLRVAGLLTLSPVKEIDSLDVSSVAAPPGDRMRQLWSRLVSDSTPELQERIDRVVNPPISPELQERIDRVVNPPISPELQERIDRVVNPPISPELQERIDRVVNPPISPELQERIDRVVNPPISPELQERIDRVVNPPISPELQERIDKYLRGPRPE